MAALHQIASDHMGLVKMVEADELTLDDISDTMEMIEGDFNDKAVSLVAVRDNMQADVSAIDNEIKRLTDRKKAIQSRQDSLIEYLRTNMERTGITSIKCPLFSITLAKGRDMVQIDNEAIISAEYLETRIISSPVKAEILKALKAGEKVPGCSLTKSKTSVRIK